ncbi:hypothetical protein [Mycobacterium sp. M23085]
MSFVATNSWSQASPERLASADLRFFDESTVVCTSPAVIAASARLTARA